MKTKSFKINFTSIFILMNIYNSNFRICQKLKLHIFDSKTVEILLKITHLQKKLIVYSVFMTYLFGNILQLCNLCRYLNFMFGYLVIFLHVCLNNSQLTLKIKNKCLFISHLINAFIILKIIVFFKNFLIFYYF